MRLPKLEEKKNGRWLDAKWISDRGDDETREGEQREDPEIETLKLGVPITGKTKEEVLGGIVDLYLQLRMDGYIVHTIHSDQGREFVDKDTKAWMRSWGILQSTTSGQDPKGNGRA